VTISIESHTYLGSLLGKPGGLYLGLFKLEATLWPMTLVLDPETVVDT
jgi:hypothetical protein